MLINSRLTRLKRCRQSYPVSTSWNTDHGLIMDFFNS